MKIVNFFWPENGGIFPELKEIAVEQICSLESTKNYKNFLFLNIKIGQFGTK
jgi:hypothetical protein